MTDDGKVSSSGWSAALAVQINIYESIGFSR